MGWASALGLYVQHCASVFPVSLWGREVGWLFSAVLLARVGICKDAPEPMVPWLRVAQSIRPQKMPQGILHKILGVPTPRE